LIDEVFLEKFLALKNSKIKKRYRLTNKETNKYTGGVALSKNKL